MGTADLLKRASIRMPGRSPGPIKAALTQPLKPSAAAVLARPTAEPLVVLYAHHGFSGCPGSGPGG